MSDSDRGPPSPSGYLSESWVVPPTTDWPALLRQRAPSDASEHSDVTDVSSSSESSWDSVRQAQEDQLQWEESIRQLQLLINVVLVPFAAKWAGRKWAYWVFGRWQMFGFSAQFWLGPLADWCRLQPSPSTTTIVHKPGAEHQSSAIFFRSLPFSAETSDLFPERGPLVHNINVGSLFQLRCFPSTKRRPPELPPRFKSEHLLRPSPPPSLVHTVDLTNPMNPCITPQQRLDQLRRSRARRKPYTLELTIIAGKRKVHKYAVIRERCKRRLREAFRLVLVRAAKTNDQGEIVVEAEPNEVGPKRWVVPGFSYVAIITLEMYRHPMPSLVDHVREALATLKARVEQAKLNQNLLSLPVLGEDEGDESDAETEEGSTVPQKSGPSWKEEGGRDQVT
ncbi:hypothetical protein ACM66B_002728 [Microbotryomycetes sp. NB124-2]